MFPRNNLLFVCGVLCSFFRYVLVKTTNRRLFFFFFFIFSCDVIARNISSSSCSSHLCAVVGFHSRMIYLNYNFVLDNLHDGYNTASSRTRKYRIRRNERTTAREKTNGMERIFFEINSFGFLFVSSAFQKSSQVKHFLFFSRLKREREKMKVILQIFQACQSIILKGKNNPFNCSCSSMGRQFDY